jgi:ribosomal protein L33
MQSLTNAFLGQRFKTSVLPAQQSQGHRQVTCMAKKKGVRLIVTLECTEARAEGATPSRYTTQKVRRELKRGKLRLAPVIRWYKGGGTRIVLASELCVCWSIVFACIRKPTCTLSALPQNKKNTPERMELKKYNKFLRRMTVHKEIK